VPGSNVDVVVANSRAFSRRDVDAMLELYAPDAVVTDRRPVGWGEFRGRAALRSYYQGLFDNVAAVHEDLEVVADDGDVIVAACVLRAEIAGQPDAGAVEFRYALRIELAGGLIAAMEIFDDAEAARAGGAG
jgi:ketosteroid isomerase-like protein